MLPLTRLYSRAAKNIKFRGMVYHPETGLVPSHRCFPICTKSYREYYQKCKDDLESYLRRMHEEDPTDNDNSDENVKGEAVGPVEGETGEDKGDGDKSKGEDNAGENDDENSEQGGGGDIESDDTSSAENGLGEDNSEDDLDGDYFLEDDAFPNPHIHVDVSAYRKRNAEADRLLDQKVEALRRAVESQLQKSKTPA